MTIQESRPDIWEQFAKENAEYYIWTENGLDYRTAQGQQEFFRSGQETTKDLMRRAKPYLRVHGRAIEIGCGIGRLTIPHAERFKEIYAVDISPTMLAKLRANAERRGISNITTFLSNESWDRNADYIYSFIVFQHIEKTAVIDEYIQRIAGALAPDGVALLHFDTRPQSLLYKIKTLMPDFLLPRPWRRGIRRIRRTPSEIEDIFRKYKLTILHEEGRNSDRHFYLLRRA